MLLSIDLLIQQTPSAIGPSRQCDLTTPQVGIDMHTSAAPVDSEGESYIDPGIRITFELERTSAIPGTMYTVGPCQGNLRPSGELRHGSTQASAYNYIY